MAPKSAAATIEKLINKISESNEVDKIIICMTIESILNKLESTLDRLDDKSSGACTEPTSMFIAEMRTPLMCLAGLDDYYSDHDQCIAGC